jgi:hypothetical protein
VDLAIDCRALEPVETRYGPALDLRELGANKVLAVFARAEPRDFIDLAELTQRFPLQDLIALAAEKDPGLDLAVVDEFMDRAWAFPRADFELRRPRPRTTARNGAWLADTDQATPRTGDRQRSCPT